MSANSRFNPRQWFPFVITVCLLFLLAAGPAAAVRDFRGAGLARATTTIDGQAAPGAAAEVRRQDRAQRRAVEALLAAARRAAQGRAQRAADHDRRRRLRRPQHLRRRDPDAGAGPHRQERPALHQLPFHGAVLADPGRADHRPQPSLGRLRRDLRAGDRLSRATTASSPRTRRPSARILKDNGYRTSWFGKNHNTPAFQASQAGPFDQWPIGMGFEYFYGFMGGDTSQWQPANLVRNTTSIYPVRRATRAGT